MLGFGLIFGSAGLAAFSDSPDQKADVGGGVIMVLFAALVIAFAGAMLTAKVTADNNGVRYRFGVIRRRVLSADVASVTVGPGSGAVYARLCIHVKTRQGKTVRFTALQRPASDKSVASCCVELLQAELDCSAGVGGALEVLPGGVAEEPGGVHGE